jgi:hypothetical protein
VQEVAGESTFAMENEAATTEVSIQEKIDGVLSMFTDLS